MATITSDDILGKIALDPSGDELGILTELHIDKEKKIITGITIDQGFMKPSLFIGINHISNFGVDTVFLKRIPFEKIKGMTVLDDKGEEFGFVEEVILKNHKISDLIMKKSKMSSKKYLISGKHIAKIKDEVILKPGYEKVLQE